MLRSRNAVRGCEVTISEVRRIEEQKKLGREELRDVVREGEREGDRNSRKRHY